MQHDLLFLLTMFLPLSPFLIIYVVGATLCIVRWHRHPHLSRLALLAFVFFFIRLLGEILLRSWLLLRQHELGLDQGTLNFYLSVLSGWGIFMGMAGWAFLLVALFSRRDWPKIVTSDEW